MDVKELTMNYSRRPVWAQIDLDAAAGNMRQLRELVGKDILITAVVKANSYGHGSVELSKTFLKNGADRLAVACLDEAVELRHAGISAKMLVLGHTAPERAEELIQYGVDVAVFHFDDAKLISDMAVKLNRPASIHIATDTGMGRIGYRPSEESIAEIKKIAALPSLILEGIFTHFCVSDMKDKTFTQEQFKRFSWFCNRLREEGVAVNVRHCCSSAATMELPDMRCDMVRPGIVQYGYDPSDEVRIGALDIKPVMSLHCCISHIKIIEAGDTVSYGRHFTAQGPTKIATLPIGYADGYPRLLSNKTDVIVHGKRVPQVGNICMDQCMIDVSSIPDVQIGDEVVLFGSQGEAAITIEEIAAKVGTIVHEITCNINRRVPRVYVQGGKVVNRVEYLFP
ncbi:MULTISPECIES: alanine racemase [Megasphaera]|uniref:Alanine racemase n=1 Tax=Megasphaera vaginalis (ex Srinivasan et al. 2021) TaxID=1111454 RepID=U7UQR2_9FIRM|nr:MULTISPECIES: alanine racemase [Megasphaera]ERT61655.1 alanine racemase [Megasphaera vaginalis (ex Srinivasan et al. 2021)]